MAYSGIEAFVQLLAEHGVQYIFGNPGSTELPLNDLLAAPNSPLQYILGLQEVPVMAMADGYSMAGGRLGVVNLHISCGLGNAMGMLYNAYREGTPLLVTAGQQDRRLRFEEPILAGEMVDVARSWTKWSVEVQRLADLPTAVRRAVQTALTPPTGPVFLSLPVDLQMELSDSLDLRPVVIPDCRIHPPQQAVAAAASMLRGARNPAILAGSRVTERGATQQLVELAELLGAVVISESGTTHGRLAFPCHHPLYGQGLPLWSPEIRGRLEPYDVLLVVGMDLFRQYVYHQPDNPIPDTARLIHLDEDSRQIGKNYATEVGLVGHTASGLQDLIGALQSEWTEQDAEQAESRRHRHQQQHEQARKLLRDEIDRQQTHGPLTPLTLMSAVADVIPDNVAVVEEAVTTTNTTLERLGALRNTTGYFGHRGWSLGWGLGCAVGVQLAWPDRPVLGIIGEGAAMYGIQALWSAARYRLPVTILIANNAQYQILKIGAQGFHLPQAGRQQYAGLDIVQPEIDFQNLARSLGVAASRASEPDEVRQQLTEALNNPAPTLLEVPITRDVPGRLNYG